MLGTAWLTLRQAQEALKNGRLDEAQRLLSQSGTQGHRRSWNLLQQLGRGYVERGEHRLADNDPEAAWHDLLRAEQVGVTADAAAALRRRLTERAVADVRGRLEAGDPGRAEEAAALLRERLVRPPEVQALEETARDWRKARELADKGDFAAAEPIAERLAHAWPEISRLQRFQEELVNRRTALAESLIQLHEAAADGRWREVMALADKVLTLAPGHAEARKLRTRAWQSVEPPTVGAPMSAPEKKSGPITDPASRFLLWIDGVGGYLVCLAPRVSLGQAVPDTTVDVALFADVSRLHATLTRDSEGYLLEAVRPLQVNGQSTEKALLEPNDRVTLGTSCQVQFRQPVPVSATARLDLVSGHRLALAVDAVLLMADTLVLGPGSQSHVVLPDLRQPIVLFRQKRGLGIRFAGAFTVDGQRCQERSTVSLTSAVRGDDFTFALEPAGTGLGRT